LSHFWDGAGGGIIGAVTSVFAVVVAYLLGRREERERQAASRDTEAMIVVGVEIRHLLTAIRRLPMPTQSAESVDEFLVGAQELRDRYLDSVGPRLADLRSGIVLHIAEIPDDALRSWYSFLAGYLRNTLKESAEFARRARVCKSQIVACISECDEFVRNFRSGIKNEALPRVPSTSPHTEDLTLTSFDLSRPTDIAMAWRNYKAACR